VRPATPVELEMLYTRMSDFAATFAEVLVVVALVVTLDTDESSSPLPPDPMA